MSEETEDLTFDDVDDGGSNEEGAEDGEESPPEKEEEGEGGDGEKEEDEEEAEEESEGAAKLKLKDGENFVEVSPDATVRVKVNGKNELISVKELSENYSGKVGYDQQFETLKKERSEHETYVQNLQGELAKIGGLMKGDSPLDAALYLAEMAGLDPVDFRSEIVNNMIDEVADLMEMSDTERELHNLKLGASIKERLAEINKGGEQQQTAEANPDHLIQAAGISKEQYEQSLQFLTEEQLDATPLKVVEHAKIAPYIDMAIDQLRPYEEDVGTDDLNELTSALAEELMKTGGQNSEDALKRVADALGYETQESEPEKKPKEDKKKAKVRPEDLTFDDEF